jgi:hypothetical protein
MKKELAKFHPILFSTPMVQGIMEDKKTMTRRIIKPRDQPFLKDDKCIIEFNATWGWVVKRSIGARSDRYEIIQQFKCPYGKVGDILWVRETFVHNGAYYLYRASQNNDDYFHDFDTYEKTEKIKWKPSIFMPKAACRIFLKITNVKVERLQDISEEDAKSEGVLLENGQYYNYQLGAHFMDGARFKWHQGIEKWVSAAESSFQTLWQSINGAESWNANPWVWVISFKKITKPENFK